MRPVAPTDRDFLLSLYASTREAELAATGWSAEVQAAFVEMQFRAQTAHYETHWPDARYEIIEHGGRPIGRLWVDHRPDEHRILDIALLTEHRGRGIGTTVLRAVQEEARRAGCAVRIHVEVNNPARRLYERLGFVEVGVDPVYVLMEWR